MITNLLKFNKSKIHARYLVRDFFDEEYYIKVYADVRSWKGKLIDHYIEYGAFEGRNPNMFFDHIWYQERNPDLNIQGLDVLLHYINEGEKQGRWPHPLFNPVWYLEMHPDVAAANISPLLHFISNGIKEGREFSPFVDVKWYQRQYPEVAELGIHPAVHFLQEGKSGGYDPSPQFSSAWYLADNPDVASSRSHPYLHFLIHGRSEGRLPVPHILRSASSWGWPSQNIDLNSFSPVLSKADFEPSRDETLKVLPIDHSHASIVSFDVWSTLIHRDCHPDEIKLQSARLLLLKSYHDLKPGFRDIRDLMRARLRAEGRSAPNGDFEFRFSDAVPLWISDVLDPSVSANRLNNIASLLIQHELKSELRSTHRDENINMFIEELDKPTIFTSDFYMSNDSISKILDNKNVNPLWMKRYSSCDSFENKRSGRLFKKLLNDLALEASDLLHVGDNAIADKAVPQALGIQTFLYEDANEAERLKWYGSGYTAFMNGDLHVHRQRILALLEEGAITHRPEEDSELFELGVRLSIIAFSFCLSVLEDAVVRDAKKVFFFTREGQFFKKVYDLLVEADPFNVAYPPSRLLPVSRRATFASSLTAFDPTELMRLWSMYSIQSLRGLTLSLNLNEDMVRHYALKHGVDFEEVLEFPWKNSKFIKLLGDVSFKGEVENSISRQRENLSLFLSQNDFTEYNGEVFVVDIGWRGTIQDNLAWMSNIAIRGHYLALFKFLNPQHPKSKKIGWLGDDNDGLRQGIRDQVAPLEMLFNGIGGSVVSYENGPDGISPVREVIDAEERVIKRLGPLQDGMLSAIARLADYARLHGLMANDFRELARDITRSLVETPPAALADLFAELTHNETFGTGDVEEVGGKLDVDALNVIVSGRALHNNLAKWLKTVRWPEGAVRQTNIAIWWTEASPQLRSFAPLPILKVYSPAVIKLLGNRLGIYAPGVLRASGGHRTIFNVTRRLALLGMEPYIFLDGLGEGIPVVEEYLAGTGARIHTSWAHQVATTVAFATIANSAEYVAKMVSATFKFYLVQDAEALFNPIGDAFVRGENSYAQGLNHITIGNWLTHVLQNQYGAASSPAGLGVDETVYYPRVDVARQKAVCMLYQPEKPRRGSQLALDALRIMKRKHPDVTIFLFGSNSYADLDFEVEQLGVITELSKLNDLYNNCRAGICLSLSNPSRIPFEMRAAGCIPVDLYRYNNLMDFDPSSAILAYQDPYSVAFALEKAIEGDFQAKPRVEACSDGQSARTLDWENDAVVGHVLASIEQNDNYGRTKVGRTYGAPPVIARECEVQSAEAFCAWQRRLADI